MTDINKSIFTGRIGSNIELRTTQNGISTCTFNLAVERPKAKDAEKAEVDWLTIVAWSNTAEFCNKYLSKGRKVIVEAVVRTRKWEDKEGKTHKVVEFHVVNIMPADSKLQVSESAQDAPSDEDLPF